LIPERLLLRKASVGAARAGGNLIDPVLVDGLVGPELDANLRGYRVPEEGLGEFQVRAVLGKANETDREEA
jgi:hypothetical protein